jgi:hypothetical protein
LPCPALAEASTLRSVAAEAERDDELIQPRIIDALQQ